jgi:hypothetical protein
LLAAPTGVRPRRSALRIDAVKAAHTGRVPGSRFICFAWSTTCFCR